MFRCSNQIIFVVNLLAAWSLGACGDGNLSGSTSGSKGKSLGIGGTNFTAYAPVDQVESGKDKIPADEVVGKLDHSPELGKANMSKPAPANGSAGDPSAEPKLGAVANNQPGDPALIATKSGVGPGFGGDSTIDSADWRVGEGLRKCLNAWGPKAPFNGSSTYRKISATISILSLGNSVNDTEVTDEPELVVLVAGLNLGSITRYRFLNPKGWYCIIADVNLVSNLNVDLHINAHLADSRVSVNILSATNNQTANFDVNVLSSVNVNRVKF